MRTLWVALIAVMLIAAFSIGINVGLLWNRDSATDTPSPTPSGGNLATATPKPAQSTPTSTATATPTINPTPAATVTETPSPRTTTITDQNITVNYSEFSRETIGNDTRLVLLIKVEYQGEPVTLNYTQFKIEILTTRGGLEPPGFYIDSGAELPEESGTFVVGGSNQVVSFKLTYQFSTLQNSNFSGLRHFATYELRYG
jgi:hypothetical protein